MLGKKIQRRNVCFLAQCNKYLFEQLERKIIRIAKKVNYSVLEIIIRKEFCFWFSLNFYKFISSGIKMNNIEREKKAKLFHRIFLSA